MIDPGQQNSLFVDMQSEDAAALAEATDAPRRTAAGAASATTATAAAPSATAAAATTATAAPSHLLHAALAILLVEKMEGRKAHIGNFFLAKHEALIGDGIERLRNIGCG